jgi:hypothetical protein
VEIADAQEQVDRQKVSSLQRQLALEWGDGVAGLSMTHRAALLDDLAHVRTELIRVELPSGVAPSKRDASIQVHGAGDSDTLEAVVLGMLPTADPRLQTRGLLTRLRGKEATVPIGQMLTAQIPAGSRAADGVVLPRSALLRQDARVWAYVQTMPTTFVRRQVVDYRPVQSGWFVSVGFAPGERVVVAGAAALLGAENPAGNNADAD